MQFTQAAEPESFKYSCDASIERINSPLNEEDWNTYNGKGTVYEDHTFGAQKDLTLYWTDYLIDMEMYEKYKDVDKFVRIKVLTEGQPSLWGSKGVLPDGVVQGSLGDCWFLAAASALAEHPERIHKIFTNTDYSEEGIY